MSGRRAAVLSRSAEAATVVTPKLELLCRYVARLSLALKRLSRDGNGLVVHRLKRAFRVGATEFLFEPLDFLARLAGLVPISRSHLIRFHGLFTSNARLVHVGASGPH